MSDAQKLIFEKKQQGGIPQLNFFKKFYEEIKDKGLTNDEIFNSYDHTEIYWSVMEDMIKNREPWVEGIVGDPASGKSTIMALHVKKNNEIRKRLKLLFLREDGTYDTKRLKEFNNLTQIVADQNEFMNLIKEELWMCGIGIDEYNRLADTGLNSSIDNVLVATYSDIFAQQGVDRISCSPSTISDINTWLILEIYGKNKKEKTTTCKIIYRDIVSNTRQCIGRITFDVSEIIEEKWFKLYRVKKFKRMELLQKRGVRKFSELILSMIVLETYYDLEKIVFEDRKVDADVVLSTAKQIMKKMKFIGSMLTESEVASETRNLLGLKHNLMKDAVKIYKEEEEDEPSEEFIARLKKRMILVEDKLKSAIEYHKGMKETYEEYISIK